MISSMLAHIMLTYFAIEYLVLVPPFKVPPQNVIQMRKQSFTQRDWFSDHATCAADWH